MFDTSTVSGYLMRMFTSLQEAHDNYVLRTHQSKVSVINIPLDIRMTNEELEQYPYDGIIKFKELSSHLESLETAIQQIE